MMTKGFVALPRKIMTLPIWQKPSYYIKIFLYLYLNANYTDDDNLKRGEVIVDLEELAKMCSSGRGGSSEIHAARDIRDAIKYICSAESELNVSCSPAVRNKIRVTLLNYDNFTNSKIAEPSVSRVPAESQPKTTIIYNNNNNKNNKQIESRKANSLKIKPTKFSNFKPRQRDYEAIKQEAKEKLRRKYCDEQQE